MDDAAAMMKVYLCICVVVFFEIHILLVQSCDGPVSVLSQPVVDYLRAVNPPRHQTLRIDREEMIDDVISHDK